MLRQSGNRVPPVRMRWFGGAVLKRINQHVHMNMEDAVEHLRLKVVKNISVPVGRNEAGQIVQRSVPGEYPRRETGDLINSLITDVGVVEPGVLEGIVGTNITHGVVLELKLSLDRTYLKRTLMEEVPILRRILTRPLD